MKAVVYMRIKDMFYAKLDIGESESLTKQKYDEAIEKLNEDKSILVKAMHLENIITPDNIDIITEEEYLNETEED